MVKDLIDLERQICAIRADGEELLTGLSYSQLNWQPAGQWSIANCVDHLIVAGSDSVSHIRESTRHGLAQGLLSGGPFRYGIFERWFVRQMEPPPKIKMKAPRAYAPLGRDPNDLMPDFLKLQDQLVECIRAAEGVDLLRVKVPNPVSRWIKFSLGQEFALNAAHERRHLWQARRVKEQLVVFGRF
jgi:hypothetical protein